MEIDITVRPQVQLAVESKPLHLSPNERDSDDRLSRDSMKSYEPNLMHGILSHSMPNRPVSSVDPLELI